jgi:hypothetical protein
MILELVRFVFFLLNWMPYYIILGAAYYSYKFLKNSYVSDVISELYNYVFVTATNSLKGTGKVSKQHRHYIHEDFNTKSKQERKCEHLEPCHESIIRKSRPKTDAHNVGDADELKMKYKRVLQQNNRLKEIGKRVVEASIVENKRPDKKKYCRCESKEHRARSSSRQRRSSSTRIHKYIELDRKN